MLFSTFGQGIVSSTELETSVVYIPDSNLKAVINSELGVSDLDADITIEQMESLKIINAQAEKIVDLTGLETAKNLIQISFTNNSISDISSISELTNITNLNLSGNEITDISPLRQLGELGKLDTLIVGKNHVSDLSLLSGLDVNTVATN